MCIGIPMKVLSAGEFTATCTSETSDARQSVDIRLVGAVAPGQWLLVFLGTARRLLEDDEAALICSALRSLSAAADGDDITGLFPDLDDREPVLPPHLEHIRRGNAVH